MKILRISKSTTLLLLLIHFALPLGAMDMARSESRTDIAVSTFGLTGEGVIVAILDRGIDWRNNDFRNADGTTRIKYIFDLTNNSGAGTSGNTYGVGTIYTEAQINAANMGGPALATRDAVGHGTSTAGIAAGNGRNHPTNKYRGIAPNASIIVVKFTTEGAVAHGDQPAETPFYNPDLLPVALDFVIDKAAELNMPAVVLANFGSIGGPTDGTSAFSRTVDARFGPGKPGLVFVNGPGDEGSMPNRAGGNVMQGQTTSIQLQKNVAGSMHLDLWYPGGDRFSVSVQTPTGTIGPFNGPATNTTSTLNSGNGVSVNHRGSNVVFYGAQNGKREIYMQFTGTGTYTINLTGTSVTAGGSFIAGINPSTIHTNNRFLTHVVPGNVWDGASTLNNISPGDYVVRTHWVDLDGIPRSITNQGAIGDIWTGSSVGPTYDGRLGVDLAAPGDSVFTTLSPTSYWSIFRHNHNQDGNGFYTRANAVSAAAPQVTGLIALMLQRNRNLDAIQIRHILRLSARRDTFTGPDPNPTWGYGKMDSFDAINLTPAITPTPTPTPTPTASPTPTPTPDIQISGRVTTPGGQGLRNATVRMTLGDGSVRIATTSSFGIYTFANIPSGSSGVLSVFSKRYRFAPRSIQVFASQSDVDFVGLE